jgi:hypothetical protein
MWQKDCYTSFYLACSAADAPLILFVLGWGIGLTSTRLETVPVLV